jgi:endogenous inhibitor of DNA gyrase (YacG/DUF329 family)
MNCKTCGLIIPDNNKFCSGGCSAKYRGQQQLKNRPILACMQCGKEYSVKPYEKDISKFCSKACHLTYQKKNNTVSPCFYCGKPVLVNWNRKRTKNPFCSPECYHKSIEARIEVSCSGCGTLFIVYKSRQSYYRRLYCSRDCYALYGNIPSTQGFTHNKEYDSIRLRVCNYACYLKWKGSVLNRDNYKCIECESDKDLRVHHILMLYKIIYKYNPTLSLDKLNDILESPEFTDVSNGITLCNSCHIKKHRK